jgi:ankyrin repeat protein
VGFPNPQDVVPLPARPNVERYKKLAKELVRACRSGDEDAIRAWAGRWLGELAKLAVGSAPRRAGGVGSVRAGAVAAFAREKLSRDSTSSPARPACSVTTAQFVIARSHGFTSWPKFAKHLDGLAQRDSATAKFEEAADAIVAGDARKLTRLLREDPKLASQRSAREHGATLLHYAAANGVENYRQKTPKNIVAIARLLLDAGAEVDATAEMYGGACTTLGLAATSVHPEKAGVQEDLLQLLLDRGAEFEAPNLAGNGHGLVEACLANGRLNAGRFLRQRGARIGLEDAAALGLLDFVKERVDEKGRLKAPLAVKELEGALNKASLYGQGNVVEFLLARWPKLAVQEGGRQTALHCAVVGGHLDIAKMLLAHGAPLEVENEYRGTVLGQALWSAAHEGEADTYMPLIEALLAAGAKLPERHVPVNKRVDEFLAKRGSKAETSWHWFGED